MKFFVGLALVWIVCCASVYAVNVDETFVSETATGSQIVVPEDLTLSQRYIMTELKELRVDLESLKREINTELNTRELASVDRALAYNANTVNFLWIIITIAVTGFGLVGWRTMKDVRENLTNNFENEIQKRVREEQKKIEDFMDQFREEQLQQSNAILENQQSIRRKQEAGYFWSQYNREESLPAKLDLLEKIAGIGIEEDTIFIFIERASIYNELKLWDKALESADKGLEIQSENTALLYDKAIAQVMLDNTEDAIKTLLNIVQINPGLRESIEEEEAFQPVLQHFNSYFKESVN